jgi:glycosyltransferase involved in cell wall biosynthesis
MITVFTPLYNREKSIYATYASLRNQTKQEHFEWLVINDGSTDGSDGIMQNIIAGHDGVFTITYIARENKGLNRTLNEGIVRAQGDLFCRLDSDDSAAPNLIEQISLHYREIENDDSICAMVFLTSVSDAINGRHPFQQPSLTSFLKYRDFYQATGDRVEVMKTHVYRAFLYPEFESEKFCPEGIVWNRLSVDYQALYIPVAVVEKTFPEDSITKSVYAVLKTNLKGTLTYYSEILNNPKASVKYKCLNSIKYFRYRLLTRTPPLRFSIPIVYQVIGGLGGILLLVYDKLTK